MADSSFNVQDHIDFKTKFDAPSGALDSGSKIAGLILFEVAPTGSEDTYTFKDVGGLSDLSQDNYSARNWLMLERLFSYSPDSAIIITYYEDVLRLHTKILKAFDILYSKQVNYIAGPDFTVTDMEIIPSDVVSKWGDGETQGQSSYTYQMFIMNNNQGKMFEKGVVTEPTSDNFLITVDNGDIQEQKFGIILDTAIPGSAASIKIEFEDSGTEYDVTVSALSANNAYYFLYSTSIYLTNGTPANTYGSSDLANSNSLIQHSISSAVFGNKWNPIASVSGTFADASTSITVTDSKDIVIGQYVTGTGMGDNAKVTDVDHYTNVVTIDVVTTSVGAAVALVFKFEEAILVSENEKEFSVELLGALCATPWGSDIIRFNYETISEFEIHQTIENGVFVPLSAKHQYISLWQDRLVVRYTSGVTAYYESPLIKAKQYISSVEIWGRVLRDMRNTFIESYMGTQNNYIQKEHMVDDININIIDYVYDLGLLQDGKALNHISLNYDAIRAYQLSNSYFTQAQLNTMTKQQILELNTDEKVFTKGNLITTKGMLFLDYTATIS